MIIKKKETVEFSDHEQRCIDMTMMLMENIVNHAEDPRLIEAASWVTEKLGEVYNYIEGAD